VKAGGGGTRIRSPSRIPWTLATTAAWFPLRRSRSQATGKAAALKAK
jgi:hypothetical protein